MATRNYLTKSQYLSGRQCHKRLWFEKNHPERRSTPPKAQQLRLNRDEAVGERARTLFRQGVPISARSLAISAEQTKIAVRSGASCIFEGSFVFENTWVRCDILQKDGDSWHLIEVKMSTSVKDKYLPDLAIQKHVLTACGIPISKVELMYLNNACKYPDLSDLFIIEDVTDQVEPLMGSVSNDIETFKAILEADNEPDVPIGGRCDKPYPCPFKAHCWEGVPTEKSIFTIPSFSWKEKDALIEAGIFQLSELPADLPLTDKQQADIHSVLAGQPKIDTETIKARLSDLEYPIHFFDFETDNPPIPGFQGLSPHQPFPFQYSCHKWHSDGTLTHHEYLHTDTTDPRLPLVKSLLNAISDKGSVVVYSTFEKRILKSLAEFLPQYAKPLRSMQARLWDQLVIFRKHYKHPDFKGSHSLKSVLPVLVPSLRYDDLEVQDGEEAQAVWNLMLDATSERERQNMIRELKAYCRLDTLAMVEIHKVLLRQVDA